MIAQVMAESTVGTQALTRRHVKFANDARLGLIVGCPWTSVRRYGSSYQNSLGLIQTVSRRAAVLALSLHDGRNRGTQVVAVGGQGSLDFLVRS